MEKREESLLSGLMCGMPVRIEYDSASCTGIVRMQPHACTDMTGAIQLFEAIDPDVVRIVTISDGREDTIYRLVGGRWQAFTMAGWSC